GHYLTIEPNPAVPVVERALQLSHVLILFRKCNAPRLGALRRQVHGYEPCETPVRPELVALASCASSTPRRAAASMVLAINSRRAPWSSSIARPASVVPLGLATRRAIDCISSPVVAAIHAVPSTVSRAATDAISSVRPRSCP